MQSVLALISLDFSSRTVGGTPPRPLCPATKAIAGSHFSRPGPAPAGGRQMVNILTEAMSDEWPASTRAASSRRRSSGPALPRAMPSFPNSFAEAAGAAQIVEMIAFTELSGRLPMTFNAKKSKRFAVLIRQ